MHHDLGNDGGDNGSDNDFSTGNDVGGDDAIDIAAGGDNHDSDNDGSGNHRHASDIAGDDNHDRDVDGSAGNHSGENRDSGAGGQPPKNAGASESQQDIFSQLVSGMEPAAAPPVQPQLMLPRMPTNFPGIDPAAFRVAPSLTAGSHPIHVVQAPLAVPGIKRRKHRGKDQVSKRKKWCCKTCNRSDCNGAKTRVRPGYSRECQFSNVVP
jgi:hypothetical protein